MRKTGLKPTDIDILIVNCSLFNPTPSLSAMVTIATIYYILHHISMSQFDISDCYLQLINKYKMRSDIRNYNLSGMGCSAGVISVDLAKDLLQARDSSPNS